MILLAMTALAQTPAHDSTYKPFTEGTCEKIEYGLLRCEDDKGNICMIYEYEDGEIRFGCKKK